LYGAVSPKDGTCVYLIMPTSNTASFQAFLDVLARKFARQDILLVLDGAPNHRCGHLIVPDNITLLYLPPYSPELNPKENLGDEIREKIFKNYALKSMDAVCAKLKQAILHLERNPKLVRSITASPISSTHSDVEMVLEPDHGMSGCCARRWRNKAYLRNRASRSSISLASSCSCSAIRSAVLFSSSAPEYAAACSTNSLIFSPIIPMRSSSSIIVGPVIALSPGLKTSN